MHAHIKFLGAQIGFTIVEELLWKSKKKQDADERRHRTKGKEGGTEKKEKL